MYTFEGSYPGQTVRLTFRQEEFQEPDSVLLFAFYQGRLLFTLNHKRGWELPGGKVNPGEAPLDAARRELYEETGAEAEVGPRAIEPIGQYVISAPGEPISAKTIYAVRVARLHRLPEGFETNAVRLYDTPPTHEAICADPGFSVILRDDVYPLALARVWEHPLVRN